MCGAQRILGPCSVMSHLHHLRHGWCLWLALTALAALGAGARAQRPRPVCASDQTERCIAGGKHEDRYYAFLVKGIQIMYEFTDDGYFALDCKLGVALDEPALPRFEPALRVREVRLTGCWPRAGSYAAALRAFNVTGPGGAPPASTYSIYLQLEFVKNFDSNVLAAMPTLRNLSIQYTTVTSADLALLPAGLERLELRYTKIGRVPAAALARLPRLDELVVVDREPVEVEATGNLSSLYLEAPSTRVSLSLPDTLGSLELVRWAVRRPEPWRSCAGLDRLSVSGPAAEALPDGWLARCVRLRTLHLLFAKNLKTLPPGVLRSAFALEDLQVSESALEALPAGLLDDTPALRVLHLKGTRLHTLPGTLFMRSKSLRELDLSGNNLKTSALDALGTMTSLTVLRLRKNNALNACPRARDTEHDLQGLSPLRDLHNLTQLDLAGTGTRRVCPDWRQLPHLQQLDLCDTSIMKLNYSDLRFNTAANITVKVPVRDLYLRREDYEGVIAAPAGPTLTLELTGLLRCDCDLYWAAAALRHSNSRLREFGGSCKFTLRELNAVQLDELVCAVPGGVCPGGCECGARDDVAWGRVLRLNCIRAELRRVPRVAALHGTAAEPAALDFRLAGNRIERLAPEDIPPKLVVLDLRGNSLREIDAETAAALVSRADRRVWLARNPLNCDCSFAAALAAMRAHPDVFRDWTSATCSDGTRLPDAESALGQSCQNGTTREPGNLERLPDSTTEGVHQNSTTPASRSVPEEVSTSRSPEKEVSGSESWVASGAAGATLTLGTVAVAALVWLAVRRRRRAARRARLPATLRLERLDAREWVYDAFVSFAHADEAVVRELVERLEGGAAPLRLCVHYRDWMPGDWIPTQIAASVRLSRRTVAVVSEAFLHSKWARAEFREAYAAGMEDGEPRLVLVLLEDPARLPLDAELRACVTGSTYVRWGDVWFWEKLQRALPAPIAHPVSESPATPPSPSPGT